MLRAVLVGVIRFYRRAISPWTPAACRFQPTCSGYALEAVERHGALKGGTLAVRRLLRCHPWGGSGYDPVPPPRSARPEGREEAGVVAPPGQRGESGATAGTPEGEGAGEDGGAGVRAHEPRTTRAMRNP